LVSQNLIYDLMYIKEITTITKETVNKKMTDFSCYITIFFYGASFLRLAVELSMFFLSF